MTLTSKQFIGCCLIVAALSRSLPAQPRLFVVPQGGDPAAYSSGTTALDAFAGGRLCVEFWASGEPTDTFGVQLGVDNPKSGDSGTMSVDCGSQIVDADRPDYLLSGRSSIVFLDCPPARYGLSLTQLGTWVTIPTTGAYVAELCYDMSADAGGRFVVDWINPGIQTYILDAQGPVPAPLADVVYDVLAVNIVPCTNDAECCDEDVYTWDQCAGGVCVHNMNTYGDVDDNGRVNIFDVFCVLNGISGDSSVCSFEDVDVEPCEGNGVLDILDVLAVLNAIAGTNSCCGGSPSRRTPVAE